VYRVLEAFSLNATLIFTLIIITKITVTASEKPRLKQHVRSASSDGIHDRITALYGLIVLFLDVTSDSVTIPITVHHRRLPLSLAVTVQFCGTHASHRVPKSFFT